ncbi:G-protein coupled receptor 55 [Alligator mississippiensis]|uniref:G-protein coupled receptor 55 n=1 Tax=Alligator mississippiensis TaxID=8496 RepID=UPI0003D0A474|nr:G-protein coupled receptor 55 [Alligator mississippiensis]
MNSSNYSQECLFTQVDTFMMSFQFAVSIPTFILGLILNSLGLWVFCCCWKKWTESSIYMVNLALIDLLLLISLPFKMYYSTQDRGQEQKGPWCAFIDSLYFVNIYGSIFTIVCISVDRYIAIKHPFKAKVFRSRRKALMVCGIIWVTVWLCSLPVFVSHPSDKVKCFHNLSDNVWSTPIIVSVEVFGFLIPMTVMVYCSAQIILTLQNRTQGEENWAEQVACMRVIAVNLIVFLISFTPAHLGILLQFLVRQHIIVDCSMKQKISLFIQVSMMLANINCCLDAIGYYFITKEFREKNLKNLRKTFSSAEAHSE